MAFIHSDGPLGIGANHNMISIVPVLGGAYASDFGIVRLCGSWLIRSDDLTPGGYIIIRSKSKPRDSELRISAPALLIPAKELLTNAISPIPRFAILR